jgi:uncharacterized integral membrane protein
MSEQNGLWAESFRVFKVNAKPVAVYIAAMMLIAFVSEHLSSGSGLTIAQAFAAAVLAIPAHLAVLKNTRPDGSLMGISNGKIVNAFAFRGIGLGLLAFLVPAIVFIALLVAGVQIAINGVISATLLLLASAFVFSKWGTMLPAAVLETDKTMATASMRSKKVFAYAFPRLLLCFGVLTVLVFVPILLVAALFNVGDMMFSQQTGIDLPLIIGILVAQIVGAFQVVMTAVILSRSYLRAEAAQVQ